MNVNKVIRDNKVAVLYSPQHGAGWYCGNEIYPEILFDPEVVALIEADKRDEIKALFEKRYGKYEGPYVGSNAQHLKIQWLPVGTQFKIVEDDGYETIVIKYDAEDWVTA